MYFEQKGINLDPKCSHRRGFVRFSNLTNLLPLSVIQAGFQQRSILFGLVGLGFFAARQVLVHQIDLQLEHSLNQNMNKSLPALLVSE